MHAERWKQIEQIFHTALKVDESRRAKFVAQACDGDEALRRSVESLLAQHSDEKSFLEVPAIDLAAQDLAPTEGPALLAEADPEVRREEFLERPAILNAPQLLDDSTLTILAVGASLGPYRIESKLGQGGMGEVYRAVDTRLGRAVAIKTTREQFTTRFEREARAISSLNHPNICTLYDVGPNYLVMELIEGETLAARLKSGPLPVETALFYASQILAALAEAHQKGIIHRDLKPGNIMIAKSGIKVLDFGLAKSAQDDTVTASQKVMGTPAYMAPEQREGKADARSDIYSFGCILHEMLTGARVGVARRPIASQKLETIVNRCLEEDPARRWQSVAALGQELSAPPAATRHGKRRSVAIALAAVFVAGLAIAGWLLSMRKAPALTNKDTIVLADFSNSTGDSVFDGALRRGLSVELEQSPFLSLVSDDRIQQTLQLMDQKPDAKLTPVIARDICLRVGSAAVLDGSIAQIGTQYLLTLKADNCATGDTLASAEAQANDKDHVLAALSQIGSQIRGKLGESLSTLQKFNTPLEQATTPSVEALKAVSEGIRVVNTGAGSDAAIPFFKHAIDLDPKFALAYSYLGIMENDILETNKSVEYDRKAYELRDRASEFEKFQITAMYEKEAVGDISKAIDTCRLWAQAYPRAYQPHDFMTGAILPVIGQYEQAISEATEAIRVRPASAIAYAQRMLSDVALDRINAAKATYAEALGRNVSNPLIDMGLYQIAFLQDNADEMARLVARDASVPGFEDQFINLQSDTAAFYGNLRVARELSGRAVESAEQAGKTGAPDIYTATSSLREAWFGNKEGARRRATLALKRSPPRDVLYLAGLAFAYSSDVPRAQELAGDLVKQFPEDTIVQFNFLPTLRAKIALDEGNSSRAIELLKAAEPYELGLSTQSPLVWTVMYPAYVRGEAYLAARQGAGAAAEFQKILVHRGLVLNQPIGALAHLQLGRAYALEAQSLQGADADAARVKARKAYQDFLTLWKSADPDIPILQQAKVEYAILK